ncbi:phenylalanyl-tRNA synthetase alpha subunit, mitochondrial [Diatrype stigma]|uniref:Phenylalanine--tRNA ligase, mitochondrial n=1 Tax=Diatrype stigma TaxID=117547 RepID=A0AAN9UG28_9PEZI
MWAIRFNAASICTGAGRRAASSVLGRGANRSNSSVFAQRRIGRRFLSEAAENTQTTAKPPPHWWVVDIDGKRYQTDGWFNVPPHVVEKVPRRLHLQKHHPIAITRQIIESVFPPPTFQYYNDLDPVVSTQQNFDSLGFPADHPGRSRSDTYYINASTLLRTHTSAHQADHFRANRSDGYLLSADVYRRDEVDRSHYPIFHQMEGARTWDRAKLPAGGDIAAQIWSDVEKLPRPQHAIAVEDPNPPFHPERNPLQSEHHSPAEAEAVAAHLKRSLELAVSEIFSRARAAAARTQEAYKPRKLKHAEALPGGGGADGEPLRVRWVEAYFPFTSPSWELEVHWGGRWLEVLGCGVVRHALYADAGHPSQLGWAFGLGLDRLAMLLFGIPDIRTFWSRDPRFLQQFAGADAADPGSLRRFVPFSKHPGCHKDVSFWLRPESETTPFSPTFYRDPSPSPSPSAAKEKEEEADDEEDGDNATTTKPMTNRERRGYPPFHEKDLMDIVRRRAGDMVEDVTLVSDYTQPGTGRRSLCYRINYRSLERTLTNDEANHVHHEIVDSLAVKFGVQIR